MPDWPPKELCAGVSFRVITEQSQAPIYRGFLLDILPNMITATTFADLVRAAVRQIPKGETKSYGEIAAAVGRPGAARAVGTIMKNNYDPTVPCHRVVRSDGKIGEYNRGGSAQKERLLREEGALK